MDREMEQELKVKTGSNNVFADMDLPNPEEQLAKADLAFDIYHTILEQSLTPKAIAETLHVDAVVAYSLVNAEPIDCSVSCLQQYLHSLRSLTVAADAPEKLAVA